MVRALVMTAFLAIALAPRGGFADEGATLGIAPGTPQVGDLIVPTQTAPAAELKVGDQAPDFTVPATDGKTYTLSTDLKGHWVVLAWFPKAFTAG